MENTGSAAPRLETPRLLLRSFEQGDVQRWSRIMRDPEVMRYMGSGARYRLKRAAAGVVSRFSDLEARRAVSSLIEHWPRFGFGEWAVVERETGLLVGKVGLIHQHNWDAEPTRIEIGWTLAPEAQGRGYATEAATSALAYAFDEMAIERVISICRVDHHRSQGVMRRLNMSLQGTTQWKGGYSLWYAADRDTWRPPVNGPAADGDRPVAAHVNYSFFHSTQSFIYFYLSRLSEVRPICLTRGRESPAISAVVPAPMAGDLYTYPDGPESRTTQAVRLGGLSIRRQLSRMPPGVAEPALRVMNRRLVPRMREDADPARYLEWAENILRRRDARLIHAYFGPIGWRMLGLRRQLGVPLVVTFLGDDIAPSLQPWWSWWIQSDGEAVDWPARMAELFDEADLLLAEGPYSRSRLVEMGCPPEKLEVQRFAIPVQELPFRPRAPRPDGSAVIVFAGRLCEQKGVLYALDAVRRLRDAGRRFEFRVIGDDTLTDGGYAARVHSYIRGHRLGDCVKLLGFLNHPQYLDELERGDIFLHPSIVDDEGLSEGGAPVTILEAQALGMPVVSTQHCDIPNVTLPGESAILVPERDGEALAEALSGLLDEPESWEAMGRAGRGHVEAHHDITKEAARLDRRYVELLDRAKGGSPVGVGR